MLREILDGRRASLDARVKAGITTQEQVKLLEELLDNIQIWLVVTSNDEKLAISKTVKASDIPYETQVFSVEDVGTELQKLSMPSA